MIDAFTRLWNMSWSHLGSHMSYLSGVSMMLPVLSGALQERQIPWQLFPKSFWIAIALVIVGVLLIFWIEKSLSKLMVKVGWMMVIPGMIALLFAAVSSDIFFDVGRQWITGFATVEPAIEWFVHHSVPKSVNVGAGYTFFGILFIWIGNKLVHIAKFV